MNLPRNLLRNQALTYLIISFCFLVLGTAHAQVDESIKVTSLVLVDAVTDQDLATLTSGEVVNLSQYSTRSFAFRVLTSGAVESVKFVSPLESRVENVAPWALFGDTNGDFAGRSLVPGSYQITAIPYNAGNAAGTVGAELTVSFTVIDAITDIQSLSPPKFLSIVDDAAPSACARPAPPSDAVTISPGTAIQQVVDKHPAGTSYLLKAGVHRMQRIKPKQGDAYYGELGPNCERLTVLNGSRLLTGFKRSGNNWSVGGQKQQGQVHGGCENDWPRCRYPEDLYFDDKPLKHVDNLNNVGPGRWYFDYDVDTIYLGDDPAGHTVEIGVTRNAFSPSATHVKVMGLVVEKYAIPPQMGAIGDQYPKSDWHIEFNEVRLNHGTGVNIADRSKLIDNYIHHNGQKGVGAGGDDVLIDGNEIAYNNYAQFRSGWEAGGTKFSHTNGLTVSNNCVHHNDGPGLWTDIKNINTVYRGNIVFRNASEGIFHEISYDALIENNLVGLNAPSGTGWLYSSQILISTSKNVEVRNNIIEVNPDHGNAISIIWQNRGSDYESTGSYVHDNDVTFLGASGLTGAAADTDVGKAKIFDTNRFDQNSYHVTDVQDKHFAWDNSTHTLAYFQSKSQGQQSTADMKIVPRRWSCAMAKE
jgi:hypothetical protein